MVSEGGYDGRIRKYRWKLGMIVTKLGEKICVNDEDLGTVKGGTKDERLSLRSCYRLWDKLLMLGVSN